MKDKLQQDVIPASNFTKNKLFCYSFCKDFIKMIKIGKKAK